MPSTRPIAAVALGQVSGSPALGSGTITSGVPAARVSGACPPRALIVYSPA